MFFIATANREGHPDCSYKSGLPEFVRVIDERTLAIPDYDGNGMYRTWGNVLVNPYIGLLFLDFENPKRIRVSGNAQVREDDPLRCEFPGSVFIVRVTAELIFPNCLRYIHQMKLNARSAYAPRPDYIAAGTGLEDVRLFPRRAAGARPQGDRETMTIKLYSWPHSSGTRIAWALEELALPYEYVQLDPKKQAHRSPKVLAVNPHGKVPALVDGELKFFESGAMLLYLGNRYGAAKGLWPAPGGQEHADAVCWTVWAMTELGPYMMQTLYHGQDAPVSYKPEDRSKAAAEYNRLQLERLLDALETRLEARDNLLGGFSLADIAGASWLLLGTTFGLLLDGHPRVAIWCKRCAERPAFKRAR